MKNIFLTLLIGLIFSSCSNGQESTLKDKEAFDDSVTIKADIPEFEVDFPETQFEVMKRETSPQNMPTVTNWILEGKDENGPFMYYVAHNKIPKDLEKLILEDPSQIDIAFQAMLTSAAQKLGGFGYEFDKTNYQEYPGMTMKCKVFSGEGIIKSSVYMINDDIFVISGGGKNINENNLNAFLKSFKLKE